MQNDHSRSQGGLEGSEEGPNLMTQYLNNPLYYMIDLAINKLNLDQLQLFAISASKTFQLLSILSLYHLCISRLP